jgi:hypothetical protein
MAIKHNKPYQGKPENSLVGGFIRGRADSHTIHGPVSPECPVADELSPASNDIEEEIRRRSRNPKYNPNGGQPKGRRLKLAVMGVPTHVLDKADPMYAQALRDAARYRKYRARELSLAHGYVSAGASSLLTTASLALAASRFLYTKVAETGEIALLKTASQLADSARQNELAAWELAAREGTARKRAAAAEMGVPWLTKDETKAVGGRPRKAALAAAEATEAEAPLPPLPPPGSDLSGWIANVAYDAVKQSEGLRSKGEELPTDHGADTGRSD